jgi:hypothetical protein
MMNKWDQIKNWIFGGAGAVALIVFYQFMQWQVSVEVSKQLSAMDIGTDAKIVAMDSSIASNARTGEENAKDIAENKQAVRDAFNVLMSGGE